MLPVVTLLFAALLMPQAHESLAAAERASALPSPAPSFCAELEGPPLLAISDDEDFMPFDDEQSCSESDALRPYDVEAPIDAA